MFTKHGTLPSCSPLRHFKIYLVCTTVFKCFKILLYIYSRALRPQYWYFLNNFYALQILYSCDYLYFKPNNNNFSLYLLELSTFKRVFFLKGSGVARGWAGWATAHPGLAMGHPWPTQKIQENITVDKKPINQYYMVNYLAH